MDMKKNSLLVRRGVRRRMGVLRRVRRLGVYRKVD